MSKGKNKNKNKNKIQTEGLKLTRAQEELMDNSVMQSYCDYITGIRTSPLGGFDGELAARASAGFVAAAKKAGVSPAVVAETASFLIEHIEDMQKKNPETWEEAATPLLNMAADLTVPQCNRNAGLHRDEIQAALDVGDFLCSVQGGEDALFSLPVQLSSGDDTADKFNVVLFNLAWGNKIGIIRRSEDDNWVLDLSLTKIYGFVLMQRLMIFHLGALARMRQIATYEVGKAAAKMCAEKERECLRLQSCLENMTGKVESLKAELKTAKHERDDAQNSEKQISERAARFETELSELRSGIDTARETAVREARAEVANLIDELTTAADTAGKTAASMEQQLDAAHKHTDELERELEQALEAATAFTTVDAPALESLTMQREPIAALASMEQLPRTCREAAELASKAFSNLVVTKRALTSASDWDGGPGETWEILRALSMAMRDGIFSGGSDLQTEFKIASGYTLTMRETRTTNADKRLRKLRTVKFDGETFDITPHVKGKSRGRNALRINFCPDAKHNRVIVGHIGSHLETYGTRRQKIAKSG